MRLGQIISDSQTKDNKSLEAGNFLKDADGVAHQINMLEGINPLKLQILKKTISYASPSLTGDLTNAYLMESKCVHV